MRTKVIAPGLVDEASWRKSKYSTGNGECVEVAQGQDVVAVRDSKFLPGHILRYTAGAWRSFLVDTKLGEFDVRR